MRIAPFRLPQSKLSDYDIGNHTMILPFAFMPIPTITTVTVPIHVETLRLMNKLILAWHMPLVYTDASKSDSNGL